MDYKKMFWASTGISLIVYLLAMAYKKFFPGGIANLAFAVTPVDINVGKQISSGLDTSIGGKILGYLGGAIPAGWEPFLLIFVTVFAVMLVGNWLNGYIGLGKTPNSRFAFDLTLGAIGVGLVLGYMSPNIGAIGVAVAMGIYFLIVVMVYNLARKYIPSADKILPTP